MRTMAEEIPHCRWAAWLGAALVAGFALVAGVAAYDHAHRAELERVEEPSAVGDAHFISLPGEAAGTFGAFQGSPLHGTRRIKRRDSKMWKAGLDDSGTFYIYRSTDPKENGTLFLKIANDTFLELDAR
jgi:hypothetical protein